MVSVAVMPLMASASFDPSMAGLDYMTDEELGPPLASPVTLSAGARVAFIYVVFPGEEPAPNYPTPALADSVAIGLTNHLYNQSVGMIDIGHTMIVNPSHANGWWVADYPASSYNNVTSVAAIARYDTCWAGSPSFLGELQAEILFKINSVYSGLALPNPFTDVALVEFIYHGNAINVPPNAVVGGYGRNSVNPDKFAFLGAMRDDFMNIYPGLLPGCQQEDDGQSIWDLRWVVSHETGHYFRLWHSPSRGCGVGDILNPDNYFYGPYSNMKQTVLPGKGPMPFHEVDLITLGWLQPTVISANQREFDLGDVRLTREILKVPVPGVTSQYFLISYHGGNGMDANLGEDETPIYPSNGLSIWHIAPFGWDLESAWGRFSDPAMPSEGPGHWSVPNATSGFDNLDLWVDLCGVEHGPPNDFTPLYDYFRNYSGSSADFFGEMSNKVEFSFRSNPNSFGQTGYPRSSPQNVPNSIVIRVREELGDRAIVDILLAPYEDVLAPNGGEVLQVGQPYAITWDKQFTTDQPAGIINTVDIYCSRGEGYDDQLIVSGVDATLGAYQWTPAAAHVSETCKIRIVYHNVNDAAHVGEDESGGTFVVADLTEAKFTDVSSQTGISYAGQPYSAVPGDLQSDMNNDLLVSVTNSFMSLNRGSEVHPSGAPQFDPSTPLAGLTSGRGVAVADYDNDGDQDVFVAHATTPKLWRSYNGLYFDITAASGLSTLASGSLAACWGDYDRDGLLDLFVTRGAYVYSEPPSALNITGAQPRLFRNLGNGNFADVTAAANLSGFANACVSPNWGDIDNDGDLDIVAMDLGTPPANNDLLFVNQGNGVFMEEHMVRMYYTGIEAYYVTGVVLADMNNDGDLDIVYSSAGAGSSVCLNDGTGYFRGNQRIQFPPQIGEVGTCYSGLQVFDHDLDGWKDVVLLSTSASAPSRSFSCVPTATGVAFLENTAAVGLSSSSRAMGSAAADFTRDGDYDLFVGRAIADGQYFYKTDAQAGANTLDRNYVKVRLASPLKANNWQGIGATVTVTAGDLVQTQVVDGGSGRGGQSDRELIFGLGDYSGSVTATVKWPRGHVQSDVPVVVSGPAAADSVNTIVDETMVISNLNVVALVVPGTTMYDWVFSWDTNVACDSSQDVLTFDQVGIQNPCWPGWTALTPSSPGVVYSYEAKAGGGYLHTFTIYGQACNLNCSFRYWAFSAMGANQATSATKSKQIKFCPSDF